jgi:hypothetical protein
MAPIENGYQFGSSDLALLLIRRAYPELTDRESPIIRAFLENHGAEYDRYEFSVRVGQGATPDPSHLPGVQAATVRNTRKRIDIILWRGGNPTIVEAKERITPAVLGQLLTYKHLLMEDRPDMREPVLATIGRYCDDDTRRVLTAAGVDVYEYPASDGA